ncbi:hypothetical protein [Zoogloea sp.]|uniref:hypothetical protein n=1 Tax=Zoogloea sp. TaxID=49181 RepID=UPI0035AF2915
MAKSYYLPKDDSGKAELLEHLAARLPVYADVLEISPADITSLQADAAAFRYTLGAFNAIQANSRLWTAFKTIQRDGGTGSTAFPHAPNLPAPVPAVPLGIIPRLTALVSRLKTARNYTEAIGQDLKIVGAEQTVDSSAWKPVLDLATEAGHPIIKWPKGDADAIEIWADRGDDKGFILATTTTAPGFTDTAAKPSTGAVWKYKAIYRLRDAQVGQWSDVVSIAVGG